MASCVPRSLLSAHGIELALSMSRRRRATTCLLLLCVDERMPVGIGAGQDERSRDDAVITHGAGGAEIR